MKAGSNHIDEFDVCVTVHHWYNSINNQQDVTIIILLIISFSSTCFGRKFRPSSGALGCVFSLWYNAPPVHYTTSWKHNVMLLRMGEIIARNMLSWLKIIIKLLFLHPVGCLYYFINELCACTSNNWCIQHLIPCRLLKFRILFLQTNFKMLETNRSSDLV